MGRVSDRIGRRKTMFGACVVLIVAVFPVFALAASGNLVFAIAGQMLLGVGVVACNIAQPVLLSELFPTRVRYTASAVTYNVAYAIFGGTAPLLAVYFIAKTGTSMAPAAYLLVVAVGAFVAAAMIPETSRISLADEMIDMAAKPATHMQ